MNGAEGIVFHSTRGVAGWRSMISVGLVNKRHCVANESAINETLRVFRLDRFPVGVQNGCDAIAVYIWGQGSMRRNAPRVLVLTLCSGEREFDRCRMSLEQQDCTSWEHRIFENLPNAEAHARLYETIMAENGNFGIFLKLDADMVLADSAVLSDLARVFEERPDLDHLVVAVSDWMTDSQIIGAHIFSNRVWWKQYEETLYVDPDPEFPGRKLVIGDPSRDLILHAGDPSPLQAFHFGAHRALQASQVYRRLQDARPHNARIQWQYLDRVWDHYERSGDRRLGLAVLAADMVFRRELPPTANEYTDAGLLTAFKNTETLDNDQIRNRLMPRWGTLKTRRQTWREALGPAKFVLVNIRGLRDGAASTFKVLLGTSAPTVKIGPRS